MCRYLFLCLLAALVLSGCGNGDNAGLPNPPISVTTRLANLEITLSAPKTRYARGETIPFTYTTKNIGTTRSELGFVGCQADRQYTHNGTAVNLSYGCVGGSWSRPIEPNAQVTNDYSWDQKSGNAQVESGSYRIRYQTNLISIDSTPVTDAQRASELIIETEIVIEGTNG